MKMKRCKQLTALFLALLMLTGCGSGKYGTASYAPSANVDTEAAGVQAADATVSESAYGRAESSFQTIVGEEGSSAYYSTTLVGTKAYLADRYTGDAGSEILRMGEGDAEPVIFYDSDFGKEMSTVACLGKTADGALLAVIETLMPDMAMDEFYLEVFDSDGNVTKEVPISKDAFSVILGDGTEVFYSPNTVVMDEDGSFVCAGNGLAMYDPEGNLLYSDFSGGSSFYGGDIAVTPEGRFFVSYLPEGGRTEIRELFPSAGRWEKLELSTTIHYNGVGSTDEGGEILFYDTMALYSADLSTGSYKKLLNWTDADVEGTFVRNVSEEDGKISLTQTDYTTGKTEFASVRPFGEGSGDGPAELLIVCGYQNMGLSSAVIDFNRSQKDYKVRVESLQVISANGSIDDQASMDKLSLMLLSENPPDLIDLSSFENTSPSARDLIEKGYVTDLMPYVDTSTEVCLADYEGSALDLCRVGDTLGAIPYSFCLTTMTVSSDTFGEISALSMEDFLSYCRQHPDQESTPLSNDGFLTMCLKDPNLEHFLDRENGRSSFDSEEFREILKTAALFPTVDPGTVTPVSAFDKAFYRWRWMDRVDEPAYDYQRYPEGKLVYSGFPTYEESPLHIIGISPNGSALAIAEASKNKTGAWKFIEYYLNTEPGFDDMTMRYGFPSRISFLERQLDSIRNNGESDLEYNAVEGYYSGKPTLTDAQIDDFCGMIEAARPVNHANDILREIITEECGAYFAGQKSIDDVIKVIQSRVDLYLSENM